ncbi:MAG: site-specific DNA-methyltransferase [Deltaproteobacteria bacterium]|nr:site-specific DNA-methyltransferase [Deltaproteobacteria bacterium]
MSIRAKIIIGDSRQMPEVADGSVELVVTSPPYWQIKDYGAAGQTGFGQSLHEYLKDLYHTWGECFRLLRPGCRLCLNIGDQFARTKVYGRYKIIPLHAEFIAQCEDLGFDFMGAIIWRKKTTMNPTGGAVIMGSYPYPPNGLLEIDYEFIQIFKKPGPARRVSPEVKAAARLTKEEWKEYFAGHWQFGGAHKSGHEARFPEELPRRLIRMFTFPDDTVLDPFLGSGTTVKAALELGRRAVGFEINPAYLDLIKKSIGRRDDFQIIARRSEGLDLPDSLYLPRIKEAKPQLAPEVFEARRDKLYKVVEILEDAAIKLDSGQTVRFLGVKVVQAAAVRRYLTERLLGKFVLLKFDGEESLDKQELAAYVYLKNKIFINAYLIKAGLAEADIELKHRLRGRFSRLMEAKLKAG